MAHLPAIFTPDRWGNLPNRLQRIGGAIDLESGEDCGILRLAFGLALVVLCLGIGFHHALNRALTRVGDSINSGFLVVNDVDSILDGLDRLSLNQRSFLRTSDLQFSQDVYESVTTIQRHMDSLRQVAREGSRLRDPIAGLDRAVDCALDSLRRSDELEKSEGPAVAVASLDKDESIAEAGKEAEHLRNLATDGVFDGVRTERKMKSILDVLF